MKLEYNKERKLYQPKLTEEMIVKQIMEGLAWNKIKVFRIRERIPGMCSRKNLSTAGIPDLIGWVMRKPFHFLAVPLFIEVKRPGGARRPAQEQFIRDAKTDGCIAGFCESWEQCVELFRSFGIKLT